MASIVASALRPLADAVLYEDEHLIVVCKPAGVPCQAVDPSVRDDLPARLEALTGAKLGVHQRLDRETSGVIAYAKSKEANRSFAEQFEKHKVTKEYVVGVQGDVSKLPPVLRDVLVEERDGLMRVQEGPGRASQRGSERHSGKRAETSVQVLEQRGNRALLRASIATGRTHQIRVQLASRGVSVAGDRWYTKSRTVGDSPTRLLLHASRLVLHHPLSAQQLTFEAPLPSDFERWLAGEALPANEASVRELFVDALEVRWGLITLASETTTTAFRLFNDEADGLAGVQLDVYGDFLVLHIHEGRLLVPEAWVIAAASSLGAKGLYLKRRPKQANRLVDTRTDDVAPPLPVAGLPAPEEFTVFEGGVPYLVRLGDGLSTGLFLDQRGNRARVAELSGGKRVLNLFAYTCAFSQAALAGGASAVTSVDVSKTALQSGERNHAMLKAARPDVTGDSRFAIEDAFAFLERAKHRGEHFDLVILDPPSYSTTKEKRFSAERDYVELASRALSVVSDGGALLACTNLHRLSNDAFRKLLFDAVRLSKRESVQLKDLPLGSDFPVAPLAAPHLKSVLVRLR